MEQKAAFDGPVGLSGLEVCLRDWWVVCLLVGWLVGWWVVWLYVRLLLNYFCHFFPSSWVVFRDMIKILRHFTHFHLFQSIFFPHH